MTEIKHTKTHWWYESAGLGEWEINCDLGVITTVYSEDYAKQIIKSVNNHEKLLGAAKGLVDQILEIGEGGVYDLDDIEQAIKDCEQ